MAKARIYGMKTKCIPNSIADRMKNKQLGRNNYGNQKKW